MTKPSSKSAAKAASTKAASTKKAAPAKKSAPKSVAPKKPAPVKAVLPAKAAPAKAVSTKTVSTKAVSVKPVSSKPAVAAPTINIGIGDKDRTKIVAGLSRLLADTYTLYLQTHNFHWNVTGPMFNTLHLMFETQYDELALAVDQIAERIRALGHPAPGTYSEFAKLTSIVETKGDLSAKEMIAVLVKGQETVVRTARGLFPAVDAANDEPSADLLTQRMQVHEKTAWMLRSLLES